MSRILLRAWRRLRRVCVSCGAPWEAMPDNRWPWNPRYCGPCMRKKANP